MNRRLPASLRTPRYVPQAGAHPYAGHLPPVAYRGIYTRPDSPTADHAGRCEADPAHLAGCVNAVRQAGYVILTAKDRNGEPHITREDC